MTLTNFKTYTFKLEIFIMLLVGLWVFIFPIPHTVAVRNIIFTILFFTILFSAFRNGIHKKLFIQNKFPLIILFIIVLYSIYISIFISPYPEYATKETLRQITQPFLYYILAVLMLSLNYSNIINIKNIISMIYLILFFHILFIFIPSVVEFLVNGHMLHRYGGPLIQKVQEANYITNLFITIAMIEIFGRFLFKEKLLIYNNIFLFISILVSVGAIYVESVRLGYISFVMTLFALLIFTIFYKKLDMKKMISIILLVSLSIISISYITFKQDKRWNSLIETLRFAWNTDQYRHWLNTKYYPAPKLKDGTPVNDSNYLRPAYLKVGSILIYENPLGQGYGRQSFKYILHNKYGEIADYSIIHPHSSIINLGLGLGIPGLILWFSFVLYLIIYSLKTYLRQPNEMSILLLFFTTGFFIRSMVDMTMQNHLFQFYMFFTGVLLMGCSKINLKLETT